MLSDDITVASTSQHETHVDMDLLQGIEPSPCPVCAAVDDTLSSRDSRGLFIVPSTRATVASISVWQRSTTGVTVVAPSIAGTLPPTELLAQIKSDAPQRPRVAIVFSDQLVSPLHAPLLVEHAGGTEYLSGLEAVAHVGYGFRVAAWIGNGFEVAPASCDTAGVLRLLLRYYAACNELGERWLMHGSQAMRLPANRARQAHRQLRLFHSAVMHALRDASLPPKYWPIVKRIKDMQKRLAGAMGA